jgi:DNA topoisomerase-2
VLNSKKISDVKPHNNFFFGEYIQDNDNHKKWIIRGKVSIINTSTVKITELPPSMTFEKYEAILDALVDNKTIVSYDDNCKDKIDYTIKFTRESLSQLDEEKLIKLLKLEESSTEIFTTLDETGKLRIFESSSEIIEYFVNFRLNYYFKRKEFILNKLRNDLKVLSNKGRFIKSILENKLEIKNQPKSEIILNIEKLGIEKIDDSYDYLLRMAIYSLTKELYDKLKEDYKNKKVEIETIEKTDPKDMYKSDLNELKKKIK